jgi:hypothetical protein
MKEDTHPATETDTLLAALTAVSETLTAQQRHVEQQAAQMGLGRAQLSSLQAVLTWAVFLRPSTQPHVRACLRTYLDVMGYLPADRKIVAHAERSRHTIDRALPRLLKGFISGTLDPETFLETGRELRLPPLRSLTRSQVELLKAIVRHQVALDRADPQDLIVPFPFPVTPVNFFGRFIAGGCDDPHKALRYLRLCTPFFVRIRSLLEGLSNDRFRFLVLQGINAAKEESSDEQEETSDGVPAGEQNASAASVFDKEAADLLHASIDNTLDFMGGYDGTIPTPLKAIKVPELPHFDTEHIDGLHRPPRQQATRVGAPFRGHPDAGPGEGAFRRSPARQPAHLGPALRLH